MATLAEVEQHRTALDDLVTLVIAELVEQWRDLDTTDVDVAKVALAGIVAELVAAYGPLAATLAAEFYEQQRAQSGVAGAFVASLAALPVAGQTTALAGWAGSALYVDEDKALTEVAGGVQRLVRNMDRDTIDLNVQRDRADVKYARYASATACAFCALLATRGFDYNSRESALRVTGEVSTGRRPRGDRKLGEKYHDFCRCIAVPEFSDSETERPAYVGGWDAAYRRATKDLGGAHDMKAILAHMREHAGLR